MLSVISSVPQQVFYQPHVQQIIYKSSNTKMLPYIPPEIIRIVLSFLRDDKKSLSACALVNHTFNLHVTPILYHTISFSYPFTFTLFVNAINGESQRSRLIRHLDLSGFSTMGLQKSDASIQNVVTPDALIKILRFCTMLEAFSVSETVNSSITAEVLKVLVFECRSLKSLDFCGISNKQAFASLANDMGRVEFAQNYDDDDDVPTYLFRKPKYVLLPHLKRLSLHECTAISESSTVLTFLAHSPNLTHLDLGGCGISDATLNFLATETNAPRTLTHLLLAKCKNISSEAVAALVTVCENLEVLNLYGDGGIINECGLITILTSPSAKKFKTLDVGSSYVTSHVLSSIQENCPSLQHLGIAKARIPSPTSLNDFLKAMPNLQYIDLTDVSCLTPINIGFVINSSNSLRVIEMSESLLKKLGPINGWKANENYTRRRHYAKQIHGERPDRIHPRKLDMVESGPERMSKNSQHYSFNV